MARAVMVSVRRVGRVVNAWMDILVSCWRAQLEVYRVKGSRG